MVGEIDWMLDRRRCCICMMSIDSGESYGQVLGTESYSSLPEKYRAKEFLIRMHSACVKEVFVH